MTSLSHDVKTPLASLVGYLEAVESKMVTGAEQGRIHSGGCGKSAPSERVCDGPV